MSRAQRTTFRAGNHDRSSAREKNPCIDESAHVRCAPSSHDDNDIIDPAMKAPFRIAADIRTPRAQRDAGLHARPEGRT